MTRTVAAHASYLVGSSEILEAFDFVCIWNSITAEEGNEMEVMLAVD